MKPWQCIHTPQTDIIQAQALPVSLANLSLCCRYRQGRRVLEETLHPQLAQHRSNEQQAVFTASSARFAVELYFLLENPLTLRATLTPLDPSSALVESLTLHIDRLRIGGHGQRMRVFKQGFQSWSETRSFDSREREARALMHWLDVLQANPRNRASGRHGEFTSEMFVLFNNPEQRASLLIGQQAQFAQYLSFRSVFDVGAKAQSQCALNLCWDFGGKQCAVNEPLALDTAAFYIGEQPQAVQDTYLESLRLSLPQRNFSPQKSAPRRELPAGWCSWYYYYTKVSHQDIRENAEIAARHEVDWQFFVLDDGYQQAISDWLLPNPKFSEGLADTAEQISGRGLLPGIWTAPFITMKNSKLAQDHPEWLLKEYDSRRPVLAGWNPGWGGRFYALDVSHPGVQIYLREVFHTLTHEYGFRFLKLDFVYAASLSGQAFNPALSAAERLRRAYQIIREAAGEDAFILGCGSPLTPSFGVVDAMRIGPDVAPYWSDWLRETLTGDSNSLSTRSAIRSILNRAPLHRRLWINDPDCLMLRETETKLSHEERFCLINAAIITGGMTVFSDRLEALPEETWLEMEQIAALSRECDQGHVLILDWLERPMPEMVWNEAGYLAVFNFGEVAQTKTLLLNQLPADAIQRGSSLREVWRGDVLPIESETLRLAAMPPHSSRLFRLEPPAEVW